MPHSAPIKAIVFCLLLATGLGSPGCETAPPAIPGSNTVGGATDQNAGQQTSGTPTASVSVSILEQLSLERINRARLRPAAEAQSSGIALDEGVPGQIDATPKQPLAMNAALVQSARSHSQDMIARDYFAHNSPEGVTPFTRMDDAGYLFVSASENLAWRGSTGSIDEVQVVEQEHTDLFVDEDIDGRGHRVTMLSGVFREVGVGIVRGIFTKDGQNFDSIMQTQDYGTPQGSPTFVLGVVYNDSNSNGRYDAGEGANGSVVTLDAVSKTTNSAGGYSFVVGQAGTYTLRFSANRSQELDINAGSPNIKVDFVGGSQIVVNLGLGPLN
ncbi:MAG TPA: CAP domain-containing protein [Phycisphaerae bacterium]|nr:CAP domain-containing protein [Phycisphaerae bacterium]